MNTALVNSIIHNISSLADLPPGLDNRTYAIRRYIGTIWELLVQDDSKADDGWYQSLLRHAETMVLAFEHAHKCDTLSDQAQSMTGEGNIFEASNGFVEALLARRRLASSVGQRSEHDLSRLLHEILDCGGDASKVERANAST